MPVYINNVQSDTGRQVHSYETWSDTEIELSAVNKQALSGNVFYFKVETAESASDWYGPVLIGEIYNELLTLLSTPTTTITSNISGLIVDAFLNIGQQLSTSLLGEAFSGPVTRNALLGISQHLQTEVDNISLLLALVDLSHNIVLDAESRAVVTALISLLQSNTITSNDLGSVLNAILNIETSYTTDISQFEPPSVHKVKFIRLKLR